jgi:hypothetical protein
MITYINAIFDGKRLTFEEVNRSSYFSNYEYLRAIDRAINDLSLKYSGNFKKFYASSKACKNWKY